VNNFYEKALSKTENFSCSFEGWVPTGHRAKRKCGARAAFSLNEV
jgi:hypothetical protein